MVQSRAPLCDPMNVRRTVLLPVLSVSAALVAAFAPVHASAAPRTPKPSPRAPKAAPKVAKPIIGIADQKATMFADTRFRALGIRVVRLNLRWDVLTEADATAALDTWMAGARQTGARPLITFDRSPRRPSYNPTPRELADAMSALRRRYPGLKEFSTWNEANLGKRPDIVARWWLALRKRCPSCTVLAVDLVDAPNMVGWARRFVRAAGRKPAVWGLHNYIGMNRRSNASTRAFLRALPGRVWLTETGGLVFRNNRSTVVLPASVPHAASVTKFILGPAVKAAGPRVQRIYLFHWDTGPKEPPTWDSGFIGPDDQPRPALDVLARALGRSLPPTPPAAPPAADTPAP